MTFRERAEEFFVNAMRRANFWGRRKLAPGVRTVVGLAFVLGGVFWWLPILGLWMLPVGLVLIALDIPGLRKPVSRWLDKWLRKNSRHERKRRATARAKK